MLFKNIDDMNDNIGYICHLGSELRNQSIIEGFFGTSDLIIDYIGKSGNMFKDDYIYPFLHLIRHGIELQLKTIMEEIVKFLKKN